jgi:cation diffusion facilitator family transporter
MVDTTNSNAEHEKKRVALSSVLAAIFLTGMKIVIGLLTNSLGILSEAAHSGLDLIAAGVTFFAVRVSDQPPDREHTYGHGKVENLSALLETFLLLITCVWIVYEAIRRLIESVHVEASLWSFVVMFTSIIVDITRSRALMKTAKKYKSQALEADALHFSTDVWSSSVVIVGLIGVWIAQWLQANKNMQVDWLHKADAIAALGVSAIVVYVSIQLGRRTIDALLDTAEKETIEKIERAVRQIPGVLQLQRIRARHGGPFTFIDILLDVPRSASFEEAHAIVQKVERTIEQLIPRSDVIIQISPVIKDRKSLIEEIRSSAARQGVSVHGIHAHDVRGHLSLEMHIEMAENLNIREAHEEVTAFEKVLYERLPALDDVVTHIEPIGDQEVLSNAIRTTSEDVQTAVERIAQDIEDISDCHDVIVHSDGKELSVSFHCFVNPELSVSEAHRLTIDLESHLRDALPHLGRVVIHTEPLQVSAEEGKPLENENPPGFENHLEE